MRRIVPLSRGGWAVALALLIPLAFMAVGWATRDIVPKPPPRPGRLPETHWAKGGNFETPRDDFGVAVVDGRIYVFGGMTGERGNKLDSVEVYDPATGRWSPGPRMTVGRSSHRAAAIGRTVYLVGGATEEDPLLDLVESIDLDTGRWTTRAPLPSPRFGHALVELGGRIYSIGGYVGGGQASGAVDVYDPLADRWTPGPPLPTPRYNLAAEVLDGKIYALGGWVDDGPSRVVEVYDPATNSWSAGPQLRDPVSNFGAAVLAGRIHVLYHTVHQVFDPAVNRWLAGEPMPTTRHGQGVAAVGDRLYAFGGCYEDPQYDLDVNEVLTPGSAPAATVPPGARSRGGILALLIGGLGALLLVLLVNSRTRRPRHSALS